MAENLIPGLPQGIRIALLQQTTDSGKSPADKDQIDEESEVKSTGCAAKTVLQRVIESDQSRKAVLYELNGKFV